MKLEYARRSAKYMRAEFFNGRPIDVRRKCKDKKFKNVLKKYFE